MIDKLKRKMIRRRDLRGLGKGELMTYVNGLPKQNRLMVRTINCGVEGLPKTNPSKQFIQDYWKTSGCNLDRLLYDRVVNAKVDC